MIGMGGMHGTDHRNVVHAGCHVGKKRTYLGATFSVRGKLPLRMFQINTLVTGSILDLRMICLDLLAMVSVKGWLRIKRINVRHTTCHEQEDHVLGGSRKMRLPGISPIR